jgi:hypothetical protein
MTAELNRRSCHIGETSEHRSKSRLRHRSGAEEAFRNNVNARGLRQATI